MRNALIAFSQQVKTILCFSFFHFLKALKKINKQKLVVNPLNKLRNEFITNKLFWFKRHFFLPKYTITNMQANMLYMQAKSG